MTTREIRTRRRAAERKAAKLERKQIAAGIRQPVPEPHGPILPPHFSDLAHPDDEFDLPLPAITPASITRAAVNRQNAQLSTGPRTPQGKLASSRNSTKHGLASGTLIIAGEDPAAFQEFLEALLAEHAPASETEEVLVVEMAQSHWLLQRALRFQNECFTPEGVDGKQLALFLRYQTTHQRAFHKALSTLLALRKIRRQQQLGFVSQTKPHAVADTGFVPQDRVSEAPTTGFVSQTGPESAAPRLLGLPQAA